MPSPKEISKKDIAKKYNSGLSVLELSQHYGISVNATRNILKRLRREKMLINQKRAYILID